MTSLISHGAPFIKWIMKQTAVQAGKIQEGQVRKMCSSCDWNMMKIQLLIL